MAFIEGPSYVVDGGLVVLLGATTVEQTGLQPGATYEFVATGGAALVRWGADNASAADNGFDFCIPSGGLMIGTCPTSVTAVNIIEANADSTAAAVVTIARIAP